tara:strand:+ start:7138 stop:7812 length:675 start_codon:yes stop_codon:yes gene_type:complete
MSRNEFWHMRQIEPKRQFRWIATIGNGDVIYKYVVRSVAKPTWTTTNKEHKILGHTFNFPGPVTWNPIDVKFVDLAGQEGDVTKGNAALFLQEAIYAAGYQFPVGIGDATLGVTKAKAASALGGLRIDQLDSAGLILESYTFHNAFIEVVNFGDTFDYDSEEFVEATLTLRYDWAKIDKGSGLRKEDLSSNASNRASTSANLSGETGLSYSSRPKNSSGGSNTY